MRLNLTTALAVLKIEKNEDADAQSSHKGLGKQPHNCNNENEDEKIESEVTKLISEILTSNEKRSNDMALSSNANKTIPLIMKHLHSYHRCIVHLVVMMKVLIIISVE